MADKILVAEDDATINEVVCEYLKEAGFDPISTADGKAAAARLAGTRDISLCILDIMLPGGSGLELLRAIRASEVYAKVPVMMLTALTDEDTQIISFNGQADDYVTKPFSPKVLVKRVEALLNRCRGSQDSILRLGPIHLDVNNYEAYENERRIDLTLKELELLKVLMSNPRKVLSRQQLLDLVWGYDYYGDERIVDAHIKNLRKKLRANLIVTVKGVGYKVESVESA
ncbi:MAG: response regulator transcription factor [Clostridiales bacterium]|nr:response regulator transcription factor [Clostridiales bacterium]